MALTVPGLASAIEAAQGTAADPTEQTKSATDLATAIINYLIANAVITGEVTSGAGAGGTVTGTLS